jgi:tricorn protease-like protein
MRASPFFRALRRRAGCVVRCLAAGVENGHQLVALVIVSSAPSGKEGASFYRVEIPSGKTTRLATLPQDAVLGMRMSPDGRSVVYTREHTPYVNFYELDYGELLKTNAPGAPRR